MMLLLLYLACSGQTDTGKPDLDSGAPATCEEDCSLLGCEDDPACAEDCFDGLDNDLDGQTDCEDSDCEASPSCVEDCDDGVDNDLDGLVDCWDSDCSGLVEPCIEICGDGLDNDAFSTMDRKSYTHEVGLSPELSIAPGRVRLGEDLWIAGTPRPPKSSTSTYFSFQIDPLLTEPWVFSP